MNINNMNINDLIEYCTNHNVPVYIEYWDGKKIQDCEKMIAKRHLRVRVTNNKVKIVSGEKYLKTIKLQYQDNLTEINIENT